MIDRRLDVMNEMFDELVLEAKLAFLKKYSYLGFTETTVSNLFVNEIVRNVPETDGSILVHIKSSLTVPFDVFKQLLFDNSVAHFNYKIGFIYDNKNVSLTLKRFYYHTKNKSVFSM